MTAHIKIKSRQDPIRVSDDDGRSLKALWLDVNGTPRNQLVDLGEVVCELREVRSIEFMEDEKFLGGGMLKGDEEERSNLEALEAFRKLPHNEKLAQKYEEIIGYFKTSYRLKNDVAPGDERIRQAEFKALGYFARNPEAVNVPREVFFDLMNT